MADVSADVARLVNYAIKNGLCTESDRRFAINRVLNVLGVSEYNETPVPDETLASPQPILDRLLEFAAQSGRLESNTPVYRDLLDTELMAAVTPFPSQVIETFYNLYIDSPEKATNWYYDFSQATNYIRTDRIAKDVKWKYESEYGELDITINRSKPEKDPTAIAKMQTMKRSGYPNCALCVENEGYAGRLDAAARGNHRIIPVVLGGEQWYIQYSPYVYYNEHCIALNSEHRPMAINKQTFVKLIDFTEQFPHYFMGSNADLPVVGGSILSHDHFQGGRYVFPIEKAGVERRFKVKGFESCECGIVRWPCSVIRIRSGDRQELVELAAHVLDKWRAYSDEGAGVRAFTGDTPHNTITPIARRRGADFELDLALRNNRTSDEHPFGIFHPHVELHHIKKENIGLIELMGLAVLPARLVGEIAGIQAYLLGDRQAFYADESLKVHRDWYDSLLEMDINKANVDEVLRGEIGRIFRRCLEDAGVFKTDAAGREAFWRFIGTL